MGSDDLHKKRKDRKTHDYTRRVAEREMYTRVLIVCEGETEAAYIQAFADNCGLHRKRIIILPCPKGSDPFSIVSYALDQVDVFDFTYCVFDGAGNTTLNKAIHSVGRGKSKGKKVVTVISYPCFEYWILMHYSNSTKDLPDDTHMVRELKKHINNYQKPMRDLFDITRDNLATAIDNAKSTFSQAKETGNPFPSTEVHVVLEHLTEISEQEK